MNDWPDPPQGYVIEVAPDGTYTSRRVGPEPALTWSQLRAFLDFALSSNEQRRANLGTAHVAKLLGVSPDRVRQLVKAGHLGVDRGPKGRGPYRFSKNHVAEYLKAVEREAGGKRKNSALGSRKS